MHSIDLIAVGKLRSKPLHALAHEYTTRLGLFSKLNITEVSPSPITGTVPAQHSRNEECTRIKKHIKKDAFVIAMDESGTTLTSKTFAQFIEKEGGRGRKLAFIIGGTAGLNTDILDNADIVLSLSTMTFPHELARVILFEQIYRAETILAGKKYHY